MAKIKLEEVVKNIVKTEIVRIDGEDKTKIEYNDGTIVYRSL